MKKNNRDGFGVVELLIILAVVGVVGGIGWYVWKGKKGEDGSRGSETGAQSTKSSEEASSPPHSELKEYKNAKVRLSFMYPSDWVVKEALSNPRDLGDEGTVSVQAPKGLTLHINPNYGGKGGGCEEDPTDKPHNTKNCSTLEVLHKEKVSAKSNLADEQDVYLFEVKYTDARDGDHAPPSLYTVFLSNNKQEISASEPLIGAWVGLGIISNIKQPNIDTSLSGVDMTNPGILKSEEVKAAEDILRSLQVL